MSDKQIDGKDLYQHLFTKDKKHEKEVFSYGENFLEYQMNVEEYIGSERKRLRKFEEAYDTENEEYDFAKEELRKKLARGGKANILFLLTECIYGDDEVSREVFFREAPDLKGYYWVYERCKELEINRNGFGDFWARGLFKTTLISEVMSLQDIMNNPRIRIGIMSYDVDRAKDIVRQTRSMLKKIQWIYPDIIPQEYNKEKLKDTETSFTVRHKGSTGALTMMVIPDKGVTGQHFNLIVYDDMMTFAIKENKEAINRAVNRIKSSFFYNTITNKKEGLQKRFIGTYYGENDVYHILEQEDSGGEPVYIPRIREGIKFESEEELENNYLDGGKHLYFTKQQWKDNVIRSGFTKEMIFSQYLLKVKRGKDTNKLPLFKPVYFNQEHTGQYSCTPYIFIDPAYTTNRSSDFSGIAVVGIGSDDTRYVFELRKHKVSHFDLFYVISDLKTQYNPKCIFIEGKKQIEDSLFDKAKLESGLQIEIVSFTTHLPKDARIFNMASELVKGKIKFSTEMDYDMKNDSNQKTDEKVNGFDLFMEEYNSYYLKAKNNIDDLLDALSHSYFVPDNQVYYDYTHRYKYMNYKKNEIEENMLWGYPKSKLTPYNVKKKRLSIW